MTEINDQKEARALSWLLYSPTHWHMGEDCALDTAVLHQHFCLHLRLWNEEFLQLKKNSILSDMLIVLKQLALFEIYYTEIYSGCTCERIRNKSLAGYSFTGMDVRAFLRCLVLKNWEELIENKWDSLLEHISFLKVCLFSKFQRVINDMYILSGTRPWEVTVLVSILTKLKNSK